MISNFGVSWFRERDTLYWCARVRCAGLPPEGVVIRTMWLDPVFAQEEAAPAIAWHIADAEQRLAKEGSV